MPKKKKINGNRYCSFCGTWLYDTERKCPLCKHKGYSVVIKPPPNKLEQIINEMEKLEHSIIATKGKEYTQQSEDRAKNFKGAAQDLDIPILKVWWVYIKKQMDAILSYVKNEKTYCGENIENRVADSVNYLHLLIYIIRQRGKK